MKPHCQIGAASTPVSRLRKAHLSWRRANGVAKPASNSRLYSRIGTARSHAGSANSPSGSTSLNGAQPAPGSRRLSACSLHCASPWTNTARSGSNARRRSSASSSARSTTRAGRLSELAPGGVDEAGQPGRLLRSRRKRRHGRRSPGALEHRADDPQLPIDGKAERCERRAEALDQHRLSRLVASQQPRVPPSVGVPKRGDLVRDIVSRQRHLEHGALAISGGGLGDVRLDPPLSVRPTSRSQSRSSSATSSPSIVIHCRPGAP